MPDLVSVDVEKYKGLECSDKGVVIKCDSGQVHRIPSAKEVQDGLDKRLKTLTSGKGIYVGPFSNGRQEISITSIDEWIELNLDGTPVDG